jgi:hypothetical protein
MRKPGLWSRWKQATPRPVRLSLAGALVGIALLQVWRPLFCLTDDNLCGWTPVLASIGRHLSSGQSPFTAPDLYGGYDLLRDPANLCLWNPLALALALLAQLPLGNTRAFVLLPDIYVGLNWLLCAGAFALLGCRLRERQPDLSDRRIVFLSLSFTFSAYALITGASWATFAANQAALPLAMLGLLHQNRRAGTILIALATLHVLLGGHLSPFFFALAFFSLFALGRGVLERDWEALRRWSLGVAGAFLVASPLLLPAARGFLDAPRSGSLPVEFTANLLIPAPIFATSFFGGTLAFAWGDYAPPAIPNAVYHIVCCAASLAVFHSIGARKRLSRLEWLLLALALGAALFVIRPAWLSTFLSHIPIYRSLRAPMREVGLFLFFIHVWIALRPVAVSPRVVRATLAASTLAWASSLLVLGPPSFSNMSRDRALVLSGAAARHWDALRPALKSSRGGFVPAIDFPVAKLNANLAACRGACSAPTTTRRCSRCLRARATSFPDWPPPMATQPLRSAAPWASSRSKTRWQSSASAAPWCFASFRSTRCAST